MSRYSPLDYILTQTGPVDAFLFPDYIKIRPDYRPLQKRCKISSTAKKSDNTVSRYNTRFTAQSLNKHHRRVKMAAPMILPTSQTYTSGKSPLRPWGSERGTRGSIASLCQTSSTRKRTCHHVQVYTSRSIYHTIFFERGHEIWRQGVTEVEYDRVWWYRSPQTSWPSVLRCWWMRGCLGYVNVWTHLQKALRIEGCKAIGMKTTK